SLATSAAVPATARSWTPASGRPQRQPIASIPSVPPPPPPLSRCRPAASTATARRSFICHPRSRHCLRPSRNRRTRSCSRASPIGDTLPCLIALGASVRLASRAGERELSVESFITGYRTTALAAGEVIVSVRIPLLVPGAEFAAYKLSKRFDQDISTVIGAF